MLQRTEVTFSSTAKGPRPKKGPNNNLFCLFYFEAGILDFTNEFKGVQILYDISVQIEGKSVDYHLMLYPYCLTNA